MVKYENPIQHGKCPAHGNKIEFVHSAKRVYCAQGKHWLNIPQKKCRICGEELSIEEIASNRQSHWTCN